MKFRKKIASLVGLVVATVIGATALAPTASASPSSFLSRMDNHGFYNDLGYNAELHVGYSICNSIAYGWRPVATAYRLWLDTPMSAARAGPFTVIAVEELCPQYAYLTYADALTELAIENYSGPAPSAGMLV